MKYVKAAIVILLMGFVIIMCFWPVYDEISWAGKLFDPMVKPIMNIIGCFAIIVIVSVIFMIFLG
jgi:hypothetical protein